MTNPAIRLKDFQEQFKKRHLKIMQRLKTHTTHSEWEQTFGANL